MSITSYTKILQKDFYKNVFFATTQLVISCSNLTIETLKQSVRYVQSYQWRPLHKK